MIVPLLHNGAYLILPLRSGMTDSEMIQLQDDMAEEVGRHHARGVILDVTAVDMMDSFATRSLRSMAHVARLRGAHAVVAGIQPDVAYAMAQLGLNLEGISTVLDLDEGLAVLARLASGRDNDA